MNNVASHLPDLPGAAAFVNRVTQDLARGRSAFALLPSTLEEDTLILACLDALHRIDILAEEVDISQSAAGESPFAFLRRAFLWDEIDRSHYVTTSQLIRNASLPQVIIVRGFAGCDLERRCAWIAYWSEWSTTAHSDAMELGYPPCALFACVTPTTHDILPAENPRLALHWWWSVLSQLDMRLACRHAHELLDGLLDTEMAWREAILPVVAGSDLALMGWLWGDILKDYAAIRSRLMSYAQYRGWSPGYARASFDAITDGDRSTSRPGSSRPPSADYRKLWAAGILDQIAEAGLEFSAAWLSISDTEESLRQRLWRGQAGLILPLVNEARLTICQSLTRRYGDTWVYAWNPPATPEDVQRLPDEPLAAEWGQIEWAFARAPMGEQHWLLLVRHGRSVRNQLAHYRLVSFGDYVRLRQLMPNG